MEASKKDRSTILKNGILEMIYSMRNVDNYSDDKTMSAKEVAAVFAEDEVEMLMQGYECLNESPRQIAEKINEEVIGQEDVINKLVFVVYFNQMANLLEEIGLDAPERINVLLIGPTGCGKTSSINALKKYFNVPIAKYSADSITSAGYIGNKVEDILVRLFEIANCDLALAERGIIYIDEFDKKVQQRSSDGRDINGKAVQEELLKLFESNTIDITLPNKNKIRFDTSKLTIILGGAFVGLSDIRKKRLSKTSIGFINDRKEMSEEELIDSGYISEDLISYGYIPEIVGRILMIAELRKLDAHDIEKIIFSSKNSPYISMTKFLANVLNVEQQISKKFFKKIAEELAESETGVRALKSKITEIFYPIIEIAFEHKNEYGICEIDEFGTYSLMYDNVTYYGDVGKKE